MAIEDFEPVPMTPEFARICRQRLKEDENDVMVRGWLNAAGQPEGEPSGVQSLEQV
jgi:hypothetical protein